MADSSVDVTALEQRVTKLESDLASAEDALGRRLLELELFVHQLSSADFLRARGNIFNASRAMDLQTLGLSVVALADAILAATQATALPVPAVSKVA